MFSKTELIKWTISQALMVVAVMALLVAIAVTGLTVVAINDYQQVPAPAAASEADEEAAIIPASRLAQITVESNLALGYVGRYGRGTNAQADIISVNFVENLT
jgi:hypothetical protein